MEREQKLGTFQNWLRFFFFFLDRKSPRPSVWNSAVCVLRVVALIFLERTIEIKYAGRVSFSKQLGGPKGVKNKWPPAKKQNKKQNK